MIKIAEKENLGSIHLSELDIETEGERIGRELAEQLISMRVCDFCTGCDGCVNYEKTAFATYIKNGMIATFTKIMDSKTVISFVNALFDKKVN